MKWMMVLDSLSHLQAGVGIFFSLKLLLFRRLCPQSICDISRLGARELRIEGEWMEVKKVWLRIQQTLFVPDGAHSLEYDCIGSGRLESGEVCRGFDR